MLRSILVPPILALIVATPFLFSKSNSKQTDVQSWQSGSTNYQAGYDSAGNPRGIPTALPNARTVNGHQQGTSPFYQANAQGSAMRRSNDALNSPLNSQNAPIGNPSLIGADNPALGQVNPWVGMPQAFPAASGAGIWSGQGIPPNFNGMTPDYGAAQTFVLPGNAHGPDFTAQPLEFLPVTNFEEIFRFDVTPNWIKQRWKRVSTSPGEKGLHGLRVALITGTNSWDLHGSLTYYLDASQRPQRITFRGWAGDATKLTNLLTQKYGFRPQQTHWAGFYIAQKKRTPTGGMLMQHPTVIQTDNPVQQVAIVLEINNPAGKSVLSQEFHSLIQGSMSTR